MRRIRLLGVLPILTRPIFGLAFLVTVWVPFQALADQIIPSARVTSSVQIREAPIGGSSPIIGRLRPNQSARLIKSVPYYFHIQTDEGIRGFVSKAWTKRVPSGNSDSTASSAGVLSVHFLDVGQGDATLLVCPNGNTMLIDAGSTSDGSSVLTRNYLVSVIEPLGLNLNYLIVSHPDTDHYNWLPDVLDQIPIGAALYVGDVNDYADQTIFRWMQTVPTMSHLLRVNDVDASDAPNEDIDCGQAEVWVLAAGIEAPNSRKNAMSIVLMVRYGDFETVLAGDATHATENSILARYPAEWLDVDVLKIGHHGSLATSTSKRWADTLRPKIAIASASYRSSHGHPRQEVIARLVPYTIEVPAHPVRTASKSDSPGRRYIFRTEEAETEGIYTTSTNGNVVVTSSGQGFEIAIDQGRELDE